MFDLRSHKKKAFGSVTKSNTTVSLPGIQKSTKLSSANKQQSRSTYLDTVSYLSTNVEYEKKDVSFVNKEQNTLKSVLKKMNYDTMELINHMKPKRSPKIPNKERQNSTIEMEVNNSEKMIANLHWEIENLKEKYRMIVDEHGDVETSKRAVAIKEEIEQMRVRNLEEKLNIGKEGK